LHALILAGGLGTRLRELVPNRPKILASVCERPFVDYQMSALRNAGVDGVTLCVGHLAEQIEEYVADGRRFGLSVTYSTETTPLGTGGAIRRALDSMEADRFLVVNGDTYLDWDFVGLCHRHGVSGASATVALTPRPTPEMGLVLLNDSGRVVEFLEKGMQDDVSAGDGFANAGVYVMERSMVASWPDGPASLERDYLPGLTREGRVFGQVVAARFHDIGTPAGLRLFEDAILAGRVPAPAAVSSSLAPEATCLADDTSVR
jgi:NDP-sugar pyrophosphorylase family protein